MFFQSPGFLLLLLPVALACVALAPRGTARTVVLVTLSYLFYSGAEPLFVGLLLFSSVVDFFVARRIAAAEFLARRRAWLGISITVNLLTLGVFKYGATMVAATSSPEQIAASASLTYLRDLVLPAGISFYTFQSMSYSIDVYRRVVEPTRDFAGFLAYVAYLPQLIAGPIERFSSLYPQLQSMVLGQAQRLWSAGFDRLSIGIAQKLLLADSCGRIVDRIAAVDGQLDLIMSWLFAIAFGLQIYYDFAGYTNMAIGISLLFGIRLSENFLSPYRALSIQDFWRRWHITLSHWFRDYVYIPLGGSANGLTRTSANLFLTMALCGLWHGAGWNYVAWGIGHGLALAGQRIWRTAGLFAMPALLSGLITYVTVHFLWVVFRLDDPFKVVQMWQGMLGLHGVERPPLLWDVAFVGALAVATFVVPNCAQRWPGSAPGWFGVLESGVLWLLAAAAILSSPQLHQFIYFQF